MDVLCVAMEADNVAWWENTDREWPFMAADLGIDRDTLMAAKGRFRQLYDIQFSNDTT